MLGPRGTGKTTWLRDRFPEALFVNLLRPDTYRELTARPERLRELVLGSPGRRDVVVDEVQRVPELLNVVHDLIESPADRRFILTGSSARKLRRGGYARDLGQFARFLEAITSPKLPFLT